MRYGAVMNAGPHEPDQILPPDERELVDRDPGAVNAWQRREATSYQLHLRW
jgi:hypothetical protein